MNNNGGKVEFIPNKEMKTIDIHVGGKVIPIKGHNTVDKMYMDRVDFATQMSCLTREMVKTIEDGMSSEQVLD